MSAAPVAIQYWLSTSSPGTWLGSGRFVDPRRPAPTRWPCFHAVLHALSAQVRGIADWELLAALARTAAWTGRRWSSPRVRRRRESATSRIPGAPLPLKCSARQPGWWQASASGARTDPTCSLNASWVPDCCARRQSTASAKETDLDPQIPYDPAALPAGVRSRFVDNNNGCVMHVLEAGHELPGRPCILLLHGFPELAYSWRRQLPFLAELGYHVVAPDLRGYGRSGGADVRYDDDLLPYSFINRVADALGLVKALGHDRVAAVIGHDYGSPVAAWCALLRPDVFRSVVMMSAAFPGAPGLPTGTAAAAVKGTLPLAGIPESLAALPRPRKHYRWYYATREANQDMWQCPQGVHDFLRAYFHHKSGDWPGNNPFPLASWAAEELAKMPTYYLMDSDRNMAQTVAPEMPAPAQVAACRWLTESELRVYSAEYGRTGFQGGLQGYRIGTDPRFVGELKAFAGRTIDVPALFVSGSRDWGTYQSPGALERMTSEVCTRMAGTHLVEGAGHWVQQERPDAVNRVLCDFLSRVIG